MNTRRCLPWLAAMLAATTFACQKPPTSELDTARQNVEQARSADTATYAPEALSTAESALAAAQAEVDAQNGKFALTRNFDHAKELLADATAKAEAARTAAAEAKVAARSRAEASLETARSGLASVDALLAALAECRRPPKGFAADLEALRGRADGLRSQLTPIEESIANEAYVNAATEADALAETLSALSADLEAAQAKIGCTPKA